MERQAALALTVIAFTLFTLITYYGARVTLWSSIIFSTFVSLILLNLFYPVNQLTTDSADFTLGIYAAIEIIGLILLAIYVTQKTLGDTRELWCQSLEE